MTMKKLKWTPQLDSELVELISKQRLSFSQAADAINKKFPDLGKTVSRGMGIGRYHRLMARGEAPEVPYKKNDARKKGHTSFGAEIKKTKISVSNVKNHTNKTAEKMEPAPVVRLVQKITKRTDTPILETTGCRFPTSHNDKRHLFCNQSMRVGASYCKFHAAIVYRPVERRIR